MGMRALVYSSVIAVLCASCAPSCERDLSDTRHEPPSDDAGAVHIIATDDAYAAPDNIPAGLRHIVFENRGSEVHEAMFVRLPDGMSADDYVAALEGGTLFPEGAMDYAGPGLTSPGEKTELWLTVDEGTYLLICWFRDHARTRPAHVFTVVATGAADAKPPPEDVVLRLVDFRIELDGELRAGSQVIRVDTPGPSLHEVDIYLLDEGSTAADVGAWYDRDQQGPAPARALGGVLDSHDISRTAWLRREFVPGRYVFRCQMPMTGTATPSSVINHAHAGMVLEVSVAGPTPASS